MGLYCYIYYDKECFGINVDVVWYIKIGDFDNIVCFGIWWEDYECGEFCDWYKIINLFISVDYDNVFYWV